MAHAAEANPLPERDCTAIVFEVLDLSEPLPIEDEGLNEFRFSDSYCASVVFTVRPKKPSDLIPWAQKNEFESCK